MRTPSLPSAYVLFLAASAAAAFLPAQAGETNMIASPEPVAVYKADDHLLSFADGRVVFDIQDRLRWEIRDNNYDFDRSTNSLTDDNWFLQRFRIGLAIQPVSWLKIYAQGQDVREIDSDRPDIPGQLGAEGDDAFDLRQGYIQIGNAKDFPLTLTVGRQVLAYGDERLIGPSDWNTIGRTFDAVKLRWETPTWALDAFASSVVQPTRGQYDESDFGNGSETHRGQVFSGLYFTTTALSFQTTDLYALYLHENDNEAYLPTAICDTNFATLGFRVKSKPGFFGPKPAVAPADGKTVADGKSAPALAAEVKPIGFDYDGEFAFQTGKLRGLDLTAFAAHVGAGYTFDAWGQPRLGVEYDYASGDRNADDGNSETFQNLFPTNHKFYGIMDLTAWQNMHQAAANLKLKPAKNVTATLGYRAFFIASTDDVWYRSNGATVVRPLTPEARGASHYEGSQIEAILSWNITKNIQLEAGYAHFFAGDYLADTGASDDADFGYVQAMFNF